MLRDFYTQEVIQYDVEDYLKGLSSPKEIKIHANYFDEFIELRLTSKKRNVTDTLVVRVFQMDKDRFFNIVEKSGIDYTLTEQRYY